MVQRWSIYGPGLSQNGSTSALRAEVISVRAYRDPTGVLWWSGNGKGYLFLTNNRTNRPRKGEKQDPLQPRPTLSLDHNGILWAALECEGFSDGS